MIAREPRPLTRTRSSEVDEGMRTVLGRPIAKVSYIGPLGDTWPGDYRSGERVHEVDMGLYIEFDTTNLAVTWAMDGLQQGLAIAAGISSLSYFGSPVAAISVGENEPWTKCIGDRVVGYAYSWQQAGDDCEDAVWALSIRLASFGTLVVALGQMEGSEPIYSPDSLAVIFDNKMAQSYFIPAGHSAALAS